MTTELHKAISTETADAIEKMVSKILEDGHVINVFDEEDALEQGCRCTDRVLNEMGASEMNTLQIDNLGSFLFLWGNSDVVEEVISDYSYRPETQKQMDDYYRIVAGEL